MSDQSVMHGSNSPKSCSSRDSPPCVLTSTRPCWKFVTASATYAQFKSSFTPDLVAPIKNFRTWAFIFCFLSIGLTTRLRELATAGWKPFWAFSSGVAVNVVLGFVLSVWVFYNYWSHL